MMKVSIALIGSNSMMMFGLKSMLENVMPMAEFMVYHTPKEMHDCANKRPYVHYFITPSAYFLDVVFFKERKTQTLILSNGELENGIPPYFHRINMLLRPNDLLRQFIEFQKKSHQRSNHMQESHNSSTLSKATYKHTLPDSEKPEILSAREIEVLQMLAKGMINKEIADALAISVNTVITHRKNIMQKLKSQSLSRLVIYALQNGYVRAEEIK